MAVLPFLAKSYAQNVYIYGNRDFATGVPAEYHQPAKEHAAATYSELQILQAWQSGYITEAEYVETMQIKVPGWTPPKVDPVNPNTEPEQPAAQATEGEAAEA